MNCQTSYQKRNNSNLINCLTWYEVYYFDTFGLNNLTFTRVSLLI